MDNDLQIVLPEVGSSLLVIILLMSPAKISMLSIGLLNLTLLTPKVWLNVLTSVLPIVCSQNL